MDLVAALKLRIRLYLNVSNARAKGLSIENVKTVFILPVSPLSSHFVYTEYIHANKQLLSYYLFKSYCSAYLHQPRTRKLSWIMLRISAADPLSPNNFMTLRFCPSDHKSTRIYSGLKKFKLNTKFISNQIVEFRKK